MKTYQAPFKAEDKKTGYRFVIGSDFTELELRAVGLKYIGAVK